MKKINNFMNLNFNIKNIKTEYNFIKIIVFLNKKAILATF